MSIERTNPITGTEVQRRWLQANAAVIEAAEEGASIGAQELHTSVDGAGLKRVFRCHENIGRTYHLGIVENESAMLALDSPLTSHACLPGDTCFRSDTQQTMRCVSNYGASVGDWESDPAGTTTTTAVAAHNTATDSHADLRTLIGDRALSLHQHARTDLPWISDPGAALLTAASASAQRTALGMTAWAVAPWTDGTTSDIPEGTQLYFTNARADARISAQKGQAGGLATLNAHGELDSTQVPALSVVDFLGQVASEAAMLALAGEKGDWCTRTDLGTDWQIIGNDPTQAASWRQSMYPASPVQSVHGRNGAVWGQVGDYDMFYLLKTAQAADSAMLGGVAASGYSQTSHTHNYAGSTTPGGDASRALVLAPLSGYADHRLAYAADGACIHREAYGRVVMHSAENGETYGVRVGQADMVSDPNFHRITNPGGATFVSQASQQAGAIAIHLPVGMTNTMVRVVGRVFEFATSSSFDFVICGYAYEVGNTWGNYPTAYIMGNPGADRRFTVRFGYDSASGKAMLYLGELSTAWSFPQVFITEVQLGYSGMSEQWTYGWNISFESTAFSNVTATVSDGQVGYRTPNAFTGAKVIGGTTYNFVNGLLVS